MNNNQPNQLQNQPVQNRNMNVKMNNWSLRKKILALGAVVILIVGVVVTILLVQRQQELRSRAEKATVLSLSPSTQNAKAGEDVNLKLEVNPGTNQVNFVKVQLKLDSETFTNASFELDPNTGFSVIEDSNYNSDTGDLTFAIGVGSDPTKVIQSTAILGNINLSTNSEAAASTKTITFGDGTQVRSVGSGDAFNENVLLNTVSAQIVIGEGERVCKPNIGTCSWDAVPNATKYKYEVISSDGNTVIAADETSSTSVEFPVDTTPGSKFTYSCYVIAVNECGESDPAKNSVECAVPSVTPTPTVTLTPTPTVTPTPTEEATPTPTQPEEEVTPTDVPEEEATPTPTEITVVTQPPAQGGSESVITSTPTPTIPAPGNPVVYGGIIGGVLFLIGGLALLLL